MRIVIAMSDACKSERLKTDLEIASPKNGSQ
jgi:hypothetical protein